MKNYKLSLAATAVAVVGFAQVAPAITFPTTPGLFLVDVATGDTAFVAAAANGFAAYANTLGDYSINISATGDTAGSAMNPSMDLDVAVATAGAGATSLLVYYSNGAFGPTSGAYTLSTTGPAAGTVVTSAYLGSTAFSQTTSLGGSLDVFPLTLNASGGISANSYYVTMEDAITGSETSVDSTFSAVPESTTLVAAALMLLPLGIGAVRSLRKEQAI